MVLALCRCCLVIFIYSCLLVGLLKLNTIRILNIKKIKHFYICYRDICLNEFCVLKFFDFLVIVIAIDPKTAINKIIPANKNCII